MRNELHMSILYSINYYYKYTLFVTNNKVNFKFEVTVELSGLLVTVFAVHRCTVAVHRADTRPAFDWFYHSIPVGFA